MQSIWNWWLESKGLGFVFLSFCYRNWVQMTVLSVLFSFSESNLLNRFSLHRCQPDVPEGEAIKLWNELLSCKVTKFEIQMACFHARAWSFYLNKSVFPQKIEAWGNHCSLSILTWASVLINREHAQQCFPKCFVDDFLLNNQFLENIGRRHYMVVKEYNSVACISSKVNKWMKQ